jgi:hypothetical protein
MYASASRLQERWHQYVRIDTISSSSCTELGFTPIKRGHDKEAAGLYLLYCMYSCKHLGLSDYCLQIERCVLIGRCLEMQLFTIFLAADVRGHEMSNTRGYWIEGVGSHLSQYLQYIMQKHVMMRCVFIICNGCEDSFISI